MTVSSTAQIVARARNNRIRNLRAMAANTKNYITVEWHKSIMLNYIDHELSLLKAETTKTRDKRLKDSDQ